MVRRKIDGMVSIEIPASEVAIGSDDVITCNDEKPRHCVSISSFLIDIEPVSVIAFCRFLNSINVEPDEVDALVGLPPSDDRIEQMQFERRDGRWLANSSVGMQPVVITGIRSERGGSWVGLIDLCRPSYRRGRTPTARGRCRGFRCVCSRCL